MKYILSYQKPHRQFIDIELIIENNKEEELEVHLPAWRPGRYELGNFSKNIQKWQVFDEKGNILASTKKTKSAWVIKTGGAEKIHIKYNYYAAELNAGSTWLDEAQLYVNPVNCLLYLPFRMGEECYVKLDVPGNYTVATAMEKIDKNLFRVKDFHELADSPFIASASLTRIVFVYEGVEFNLWFQGLEKPDRAKLLNDFFLFTHEQYLIFNEFPAKEYHYLFQVLPYKAYHGVEHQNSTVVTLGPAHAVMDGYMYNELLGVSSHELFHAWNIKAIRPAEMFPYNYASENYCRLGFVYEGVTTYYGDLMLFRSGAFTQAEFFGTFNAQLQKHFDNFGRFNLSVADSSFDTWLDGYAPGIPDRKTSIYTEGCLIAFITDILIRRETKNSKSLDDVMRALYHDFAKKSKGYCEDDYIETVSKTAGKDLRGIFKSYVYGTESYEPLLQECLDYIGCRIESTPSAKFHEAYLGIKTVVENGRIIVKNIYPDGAADEAGISVNDEITAVNGVKVNNDLDDWCRYFTGGRQDIILTIVRYSEVRQITVPVPGRVFYKIYKLAKLREIDSSRQNNFESWSGNKL